MRALVVGTMVIVGLMVVGCGESGSKGGKNGGGGSTSSVGNAANPALDSGDWKAAASRSRERGVEFLLAQAKDGKWAFAPEHGPDVGITAICATGILASGHEKGRAAMAPTLDWLVSLQKPDGSIHQGSVASYCTAASVLAFEASGDPKYVAATRKAQKYLESVQLEEEEGLSRGSKFYGGFGYKKGNPNPNLSTTQWALDAASSGVPKGSDFYKKALVFLNRVQNRSESNDWKETKDGKKVEAGNDGGAYYQPWDSKAGVVELPGGRHAFRSYGSMSYALLKCYLLCDLDVRNPRVRAVLGWLGKNWDLERNPGLEHLDDPAADQMGLFYYYFTIGRTLGIAEQKGVELEGDLAAWRAGLTRALAERQSDDGSWVNPQPRWYEGNRPLVTAYALLALNEVLR